jgi:hypothetical protein
MVHREALLDALGKGALGIYPDQWGVGRLRIALSYLTWLTTRAAWRKLPVPTIPLQEVPHDEPSFAQ